MMCNAYEIEPKREPWNKGKLIGQKPPLQPKHVWAIRARLQLDGRIRDLALFNIAIDSKLRGCDVVRLKVDDVALHGYAMDRATVRQRKTGRPVKFEVTEQTRQSIDGYLRLSRKMPGTTCFQEEGQTPAIWALANMRVWCRAGYPASVSIHHSSARTRCDERRPR